MTTLENRPAATAPAPEVPRSVTTTTADDSLNVYGAFIASLAIVWLVWDHFLATRGALGFVLVWMVTFVAIYGAVTALNNPRPVVVDRLMTVVLTTGACIVALALFSAVIYTFMKGWGALKHPNFYHSDMAGVGPTAPLNQGGVGHAILGSLIEIGIAVIITLPLGVGAAIFMTEIGGPFARPVRTVIEAMTALPSIVAGLFIYSTLIVQVGVEKSGFAASMALSVMMLPIIARASDVVLRVVPDGLRQAALGLGASRLRVVWHVVLPSARSGLATALILGIARGVGETSPVLLTSGAFTHFNHDPFHEPMNSLPLFIFTTVRSGQDTAIQRGFGCAAVLLGVVLALFIVARLLSRKPTSR